MRVSKNSLRKRTADPRLRCWIIVLTWKSTIGKSRWAMARAVTSPRRLSRTMILALSMTKRNCYQSKHYRKRKCKAMMALFTHLATALMYMISRWCSIRQGIGWDVDLLASSTTLAKTSIKLNSRYKLSPVRRSTVDLRRVPDKIKSQVNCQGLATTTPSCTTQCKQRVKKERGRGAR